MSRQYVLLLVLPEDVDLSDELLDAAHLDGDILLLHVEFVAEDRVGYQLRNDLDLERLRVLHQEGQQLVELVLLNVGLDYLPDDELGELLSK